jgi:hypothetical protein
MSGLDKMKKSKIGALCFVATCLLLFMAPAVHAASAQQTGSISEATNIQALTARFYASSELERPTIASQLRRALGARNAQEQPLARARAHIVLARQAAFEGRKDLCLREGRAALALVEQIGPEDRAEIAALAAVMIGQAQWLKEDYLTAARTIAEARLAYGRPKATVDATWDEMLLWETIIKTNAPLSLRERINQVSVSNTQERALADPGRADCGGVVRILGREPIYPVNSMINGKRGGVIVRTAVTAAGAVQSLTVTAYSPSVGFAAAVETAAATHRFEIAPDAPQACRAGVPWLVTFGNM